jgi:hypothetical protein
MRAMVGGLWLGAALLHLTLAALGDTEPDGFGAGLPPDQANRAWACRSALARFLVLDGFRFKALDQRKDASGTQTVWLRIGPPSEPDRYRVGCLYAPDLPEPGFMYSTDLPLREPSPRRIGPTIP